MTKNTNSNNGKIELNLDLTKYELERLEKNLNIFNKNVTEENKLTLEEYISIVLEVSLLEYKLDSKYNFLNILKNEIEELETELKTKYSIGLTGSEEVFNEALEVRKQTLKESSMYTKNYHSAYVNSLVTFIEFIIYSFDKDIEDAILTLKEGLEVDVKKNPADVNNAIHIAKTNLKPNHVQYNSFLKLLEEFEKYVELS